MWTQNLAGCIAWLGIVTSRTPRWSSGESLWRKIPGYLHSSIDVVAEASAEEKPGPIRFFALHCYCMSVAEGIESMWSLHGRFPPEQASTQSTMRFFCDLKNMIVAIIKSTKVHLGLAWRLEPVIWGESVHTFSFLFLLEWKEEDVLVFLQAKCLFPAQVFGWTPLLVRDLWSSPPVVALACLHILPYLCILQDQRLLLFWIIPEAEHCFFFVFFPLNRNVWPAQIGAVLPLVLEDCFWVSSWS